MHIGQMGGHLFKSSFNWSGWVLYSITVTPPLIKIHWAIPSKFGLFWCAMWYQQRTWYFLAYVHLMIITHWSPLFFGKNMSWFWMQQQVTVIDTVASFAISRWSETKSASYKQNKAKLSRQIQIIYRNDLTSKNITSVIKMILSSAWFSPPIVFT